MVGMSEQIIKSIALKGKHVGLALIACDPSDALNLVKVRWQKTPNETWRHGFGLMLLNLGICFYFGRV